MKITVLNGSPKGDFSISLQSILYLKKHFPEDSFTIINVGAKIKSLEKDFNMVAAPLKEADIVLFCYPVYTFLVPSQLHRCIELMKKHFPQGLKGKAAAQFSTSKHFYDMTAHEFIRENCIDMEMTWLDGMSADMEDLLSETGRKELVDFWKHIHYIYGRKHGLEPEKPSAKYDITVVTNSKNDPVLDKMIDEFIAACPSPVKILNIADFTFYGGCLGCFNCASDGVCIYKDGFSDLLRNEIQKSSAIIYAFTVRDHSMGADFKIFDDRQFCNGHRMMTIGMPVGYLINGDIAVEHNLMTVIRARAQVGRNTLCGMVSSIPSPETVSAKELSDSIIRALNTHYMPPQNFWGTGGTKIFRDLIYLMRGIMPADHKFYKKAGLYNDFPQRHTVTMIKMKLVGFLMNNRKIKSAARAKINEGMIAPYKKVIR